MKPKSNRNRNHQSANPADAYQAITDQIIAGIEEGVETFEMPWHQVGPNLSLPINVATNNAYQGVNILFLWNATKSRSFKDEHWGTYRQWQDLGAQVRKGEKSTRILFCKPVVSDEAADAQAGDTRETTKAPVQWITKRASVFNRAQTEGYQEPELDQPNRVEPLDAAEALIKRVGAKIREGEDQAYYSVERDETVMPLQSQFKASEHSSETEAYYATLFHELIHWTGHETRLNREASHRRDPAYAREELVAELGSAFLCAELGISLTAKPENAAYCKSWLKILKNDKSAIAKAASKASQAVRFLRELQ